MICERCGVRFNTAHLCHEDIFAGAERIGFSRVPAFPVCNKRGIAPYPCDSAPRLRAELHEWLCEEHYFQRQVAAKWRQS